MNRILLIATTTLILGGLSTARALAQNDDAGPLTGGTAANEAPAAGTGGAAAKEPAADREKNNTMTLVVVPEEAQFTVGWDVIKALEAAGIRRIDGKTADGRVVRVPGLFLNLEIAPSRKYGDAINPDPTRQERDASEWVELIMGLQRLTTKPLYVSISGPNFGATVVWTDSALDKEATRIVDYLKERRPQLDIQKRVRKPAAPFTARLMLVKGDWSVAASAKQIDADLRRAVTAADVPQALLDKLPASGAQVLFPPEVVGLYSPENYAQLLGWLKAHELIESSGDFPAPEPPLVGEKHSRAFDFAEAVGCLESTLRRGDEFLPLPLTRAQAFVSSKPRFSWTVLARESAIDFSCFFVEEQQLRGQGLRYVGGHSSGLSFELADRQVAVVNAFPGRDNQAFRDATLARGFLPLIVVERGSLDFREFKPRVTLPEKIDMPTVNVHHEGTYVWPAPGADERSAAAPRGRDRSSSSAPRTSPNRTTPQRGSSTEIDRTSPEPADVAVGTDDAVGGPAAPRLIQCHAKHRTPESLIGTINRLLPSNALTMVGDAEGKTFLLRGPPGEVESALEILRLADQPRAAADTTGAGPDVAELEPLGEPVPVERSRTSAPRSIALQGEYETHEKRAAELAADIRQRAAAEKSESTRTKELRRELAQVVGAAFAARQQLLQAELGEFRQRMQRIEQTLEQRNRIRAQIIERRVGDLLNPDRQWSAPEDNSRPRDPDAPQTRLTPDSEPILGAPGNSPREAADKPANAIATCELTTAEPRDDGTMVHRTSHIVATVVSDDGLAVTALEPRAQPADLQRIQRVTLIFIDRSTDSGRLVSYDGETGLALFQTGGPGKPFLQPDSAPPGIDQQLGLYRGPGIPMPATVVDRPAVRTGVGLHFARTSTPQPLPPGSAFVDSTGRLRGVLSHASSDPIRNVISSEKIVELIQRHRNGGDASLRAPEKTVAARGQPATANPAGAVAWGELSVAEQKSDGTTTSTVDYVSGTVVSDDGLVAVMLRAGREEQKVLQSYERGSLFFAGGVRDDGARLVAYEEKSGLALMKLSLAGQSFLPLETTRPGLNQRLTMYDALDQNRWDMLAMMVVATPGGATSPFDPDNFLAALRLIKNRNDASLDGRRGAAFVDSAGRLRGIGTERGHPEVGPRAEGVAHPRGFVEVVPGEAVVRLIEKYRGRTASGE